MFKNILALVVLLSAVASIAAVDINQADAAELDSIRGIGPAMSSKILDARKSGNFKDWDDLIARVKGVGQGNAVRFSGQGLTVNGASYKVEAAQSAASAARK